MAGEQYGRVSLTFLDSHLESLLTSAVIEKNSYFLMSHFVSYFSFRKVFDNSHILFERAMDDLPENVVSFKIYSLK